MPPAKASLTVGVADDDAGLWYLLLRCHLQSLSEACCLQPFFSGTGIGRGGSVYDYHPRAEQIPGCPGQPVPQAKSLRVSMQPRSCAGCGFLSVLEVGAVCLTNQPK